MQASGKRYVSIDRRPFRREIWNFRTGNADDPIPTIAEKRHLQGLESSSTASASDPTDCGRAQVGFAAMAIFGTALRKQRTNPPADAGGLADIVLPDHEGAEHRLGDYWRDRPVALIWLRHYG
jgi:hypothetical protein